MFQWYEVGVFPMISTSVPGLVIQNWYSTSRIALSVRCFAHWFIRISYICIFVFRICARACKKATLQKQGDASFAFSPDFRRAFLSSISSARWHKFLLLKFFWEKKVPNFPLRHQHSQVRLSSDDGFLVIKQKSQKSYSFVTEKWRQKLQALLYNYRHSASEPRNQVN